jgi:3-hydroxybutyrate dehydrogenase
MSDRVAADAVRPVAVITGAGSGLGLAIARRLHDVDDYHVIAVDRRPEAAPGLHVAADLSHADGNKAAVGAALDEYGRIDAVVACAGFQSMHAIADFPEDVWDKMIAVMLTSPFLLAKYSWSALTASPRGRFVAISSAHGHVALPHKAAYVAAKHGVLGLIKTLALEGAGDGISAVAVCPGFVATPLIEQRVVELAERKRIPRSDAEAEFVREVHPLRAMVPVESVIDAVRWALSESGGALTGGTIDIDNGWTAR